MDPNLALPELIAAALGPLADYHALERELEKRGFSHDRSPEAPICRWD